MQRQSGSVLDAYIASQANGGVSQTFGSNDLLAFKSSAAANFGREYGTLVRPHPQYHHVADTQSGYDVLADSVGCKDTQAELQLRCRAGNKPYNSSETAAFHPAAWQQNSRACTATEDPWAFAHPQQMMLGYGNDSHGSWQQQLANLQQTSATEQNAQAQQQGWLRGDESAMQAEQHQLLNQLQHQQLQPQPPQQPQPQQQQQNPQIVHKPSSGDQLVQDLRAHWGSMASPPPQPQPPLTSTHPQPLGAPASQSGFEHMWGLTPAPPLGTQSALGLPPSQPGTTPASRLAEDAALLDFPDWDGPGGGPPSLDDMIMNSIGVPGAQAASDSLLPQLAGQEQVATANQPQQIKAGSKKKQRGGKKAAAKGGKGTRTASGSMAPAADPEGEVTVEFFVPADEGRTGFELRESKVKPVIVSKSEPEAKPLPASALSVLHAGLPSSDPGMHLLQWAFAEHLPKAWAAQ